MHQRAKNLKESTKLFLGIALVVVFMCSCPSLTTPAERKSTIPADTVADTIELLPSDGPHTIAVTGAITDDTISAIRTALKKNFSAKVALDLSGTTGLTSIAYGAFSPCNTLTSVTIPDSVTTIEGSAFMSCSRLTSVTIPDSVTTIGDSAFMGCSRLTSVSIPNSVTEIGLGAFSDCNSLTTFTVNSGNTEYIASDDGKVLFNKDRTTLVAYPSASDAVTISAGVTIIGAEAFYGCNSLTNVTIPNSVTKIGADAFRGCNSLTNVSISDTVTKIGDRAFYGCSSLMSVTIPNSVTKIGDNAFYCCDSLTSVTIPASVTTIGMDAFYNCDSLTSVTFADTSTWYYTSNRTFTDGTQIDVTNPATNVTYLTDTYSGKNWYKN